MHIVVYAGLLAFAIVYDQIIGWLERHHYSEGFIALEVVFGVAITLIGVALLDRDAANTAFWAFVASGLPMVIGHSWRYAKARKAGQDALREGLNADESETLAE